MLLYLKAFTNKILDPDFAACERNGVDQGIHNVLVYKKMQHLPDIHKIVFEHQSSGVVAHMQVAESTGNMKYTGGTEVRNSAGTRAIVMHQYDRNKELRRGIYAKWIDWSPVEEVVGSDVKDCEKYRLVQNLELFDGIGDFEGSSTGGEQLHFSNCCRLCQNFSGSCSAFAHVGTTCWLKHMSSSELEAYNNQAFGELEPIVEAGRIVPDSCSGWLRSVPSRPKKRT